MAAKQGMGGRGGAAREDAEALRALDARIAGVRAARAPKRNPGADTFNAAALAWRMVTELVVGVLLGAGIGWGLDSVIGTLPAFLTVFTLLGFAAGVRTMMRSADEVRARGGRGAGGETGPGGAGDETGSGGAADEGSGRSG